MKGHPTKLFQTVSLTEFSMSLCRPSCQVVFVSVDTGRLQLYLLEGNLTHEPVNIARIGPGLLCQGWLMA